IHNPVGHTEYLSTIRRIKSHNISRLIGIFFLHKQQTALLDHRAHAVRSLIIDLPPCQKSQSGHKKDAEQDSPEKACENFHHFMTDFIELIHSNHLTQHRAVSQKKLLAGSALSRHTEPLQYII